MVENISQRNQSTLIADLGSYLERLRTNEVEKAKTSKERDQYIVYDQAKSSNPKSNSENQDSRGFLLKTFIFNKNFIRFTHFLLINKVLVERLRTF